VGGAEEKGPWSPGRLEVTVPAAFTLHRFLGAVQVRPAQPRI
jgi:hypothetical protein